MVIGVPLLVISVLPVAILLLLIVVFDCDPVKVSAAVVDMGTETDANFGLNFFFYVF